MEVKQEYQLIFFLRIRDSFSQISNFTFRNSVYYFDSIFEVNSSTFILQNLNLTNGIHKKILISFESNVVLMNCLFQNINFIHTDGPSFWLTGTKPSVYNFENITFTGNIFYSNCFIFNGIYLDIIINSILFANNSGNDSIFLFEFLQNCAIRFVNYHKIINNSLSNYCDCLFLF